MRNIYWYPADASKRTLQLFPYVREEAIADNLVDWFDEQVKETPLHLGMRIRSINNPEDGDGVIVGLDGEGVFINWDNVEYQDAFVHISYEDSYTATGKIFYMTPTVERFKKDFEVLG